MARHPTRLLRVVVAIALALSACGSTAEDGPGPVERVLADNEVTYDLRQRLTREEVGLEPGEARLAIDHPGGEPLIAVTVLLPDDTRLEVAASVVNIAADGSASAGDGDEPDPNGLELVRSYRSVDEAAEALTADIDVLALDPASVDRWAEWARSFMDEGGTEAGATFASRAFPNTTYGDVVLSASVGTFADTGIVRVHYHLSWDLDWD